jgi:hypothetical protein
MVVADKICSEVKGSIRQYFVFVWFKELLLCWHVCCNLHGSGYTEISNLQTSDFLAQAITLLIKKIQCNLCQSYGLPHVSSTLMQFSGEFKMKSGQRWIKRWRSCSINVWQCCGCDIITEALLPITSRTKTRSLQHQHQVTLSLIY